MLRIKILNRNNHPFTNKIKVCGVSIEVILISFFILIVLFLAAVHRKQVHDNGKPGKRELPIVKHIK